MINASTPCKDCEKRTMTCHDDCEEYLAFRAEREASRKKAMAHLAVEDYVRDEITKAFRKKQRDRPTKRRPQ